MLEFHVAMNDVKSLETYILDETVRVETAHTITLNKTDCDKQMLALTDFDAKKKNCFENMLTSKCKNKV